MVDRKEVAHTGALHPVAAKSPLSPAAAAAALSATSPAVPAASPAAAAPAPAPAAARKSQPFWLGGAASMGAACVSHPLDLLKVRQQLQTAAAAAPAASSSSASSSSAAAAAAAAPRPKSEGMWRLAFGIVKTEGPLSLYSGLSASLLRQASYSTVRFGVYEGLKDRRLASMQRDYDATGSASSPSLCAPPRDLGMLDCICFSLVGGALGGVVGNPADLVNVRMQNDKKLAPSERRNYAGVFEALARIARQEGLAALWNGVGPNVVRAMLMTAGQLASYDAFKHALVTHAGADPKHVSTHLISSCAAGVVATILTQPVDVVKTRVMNASKSRAAAAAASAGGSAASAIHASTASSAAASTSVAASCAPAPSSSAGQGGTLSLVRSMFVREGAGAFFKGFVPALTRLGPHTIATFLLLEQLKKAVGA